MTGIEVTDTRAMLASYLRGLADSEAITDHRDVQWLGLAADALTEAAGPALDVAHLTRQREWSTEAFGPGIRLGVIDHLEKELVEVRAHPEDLHEWVDVVILGLDGAWRSGATPEQIIEAIKAKQTKNEGRVWPDWRLTSSDVAIEHDRTDEVPPSLFDACRRATQEREWPDGFTPVEVLDEIHKRWPGAYPLCSVIDVADELRAYYGKP